MASLEDILVKKHLKRTKARIMILKVLEKSLPLRQERCMNWYGAKTPASVCPRCIATAKPWRRRGCSIGPPPCPTASPAMNMPMTRRCTMPSAFPATVFSRWMWIWRKDTGSTWTRNTALKWRSRRWKSTDTAANAGLPEKRRNIRGKWNYYKDKENPGRTAK